MTSTTAIPDLHLLPDFKWTLKQYHHMIKAGILTEDQRVELLFGKIVEMSPIGRFHAACVKQINRYFHKKLGDAVTIGIQDPVTLLEESESGPDISILKYRSDNYVSQHPQGPDIILLIEVSDQTLQKDRTVKKTIYAMAGVADYWIVNLIDRQIEQYLQPKNDGSYAQVNIFSESESFDSEHCGHVFVKDLLPY